MSSRDFVTKPPTGRGRPDVRRRKLREPVDAPVLANPVAHSYMASVSILGKSRSFGLLGSEALLLLGEGRIKLASLITESWNPLIEWLRGLSTLRNMVGIEAAAASAAASWRR